MAEEQLAEYEVLVIEFVQLVLSDRELTLSRGLKYVFRRTDLEYRLAAGGGLAAPDKEPDRL